MNRYALLLTAVLVFLASNVALSKDAPRLTSDQAIAIARTYCAAVGQPQTGAATTTFPYTGDDEGDGPLYYLPHWQVSFQSDPTVDVVDATGMVASFSHEGASSHRYGDAPAIVTPSAADSAAIGALKASGQPFSELSLTPETEYRDGEYIVDWTRMYHGVPYRQGALVAIDGLNGAVTTLLVHFTSPPATRAEFKITGEQALQLADNHLKSKDVHDCVLTDYSRELAMPDLGFWNGGGYHQDYRDPPVPAWHVYFNTPYNVFEVLVDGVTGAIIGGAGSEHGFCDAKTGDDLIRAMVNGATKVQLFTMDKEGAWGKNPTAELSDVNDHQVLSDLAEAPKWTGASENVIDSIRLSITNGKKSYTIYYSPRLKVFGSPGSWVKAPQSFENATKNKLEE